MDFDYKITKEISILSEKNDGKYTLELNLISYKGKEEKFDLRRWDRSSDKMLKGLTLDKEEIKSLKQALNSLDLE